MALTRAGDDLAFERLYKRYQRRIAAYVHGMVHDHGRSEDITQEVFMSALRRMRETDRPIVFKPWVYEIAKNACIDAFRRSKRAEEISYDADEGLGGSDHGGLVSTSPTPDAAVDARMSLDHLRGAFGGLSEMHHDILVMRELEGLSYREIGQRLGMSRPSVESTLFRARRRLTEEYEELTSGERCRRIQAIVADAGGRRLGVRDERRMARHVSYCQPCRRAAYSAGFDVAALAPRTSLRDKVAALLPLPAFLKRRWFGGDGGSSTVAEWSATASPYAEPISGWAKAAAVAATVAVAGIGAGVVPTHGDTGSRQGPAAAGVVPASATGAAAAAKAAHERTGASGGAAARSEASRPSHGARSTAPARRRGARKGGAGGAGGAGGGGVGGGGSASASAGGSTAGGGSASKAGAGSGGRSGATHTLKNVLPKASTATAPKVKAPTVTAPTVGAPKTGNGTVDRVTGTATGAVNGAVGAATGAVNGLTGAATGTVNGAAGAATGAVTGAAATVSAAVSNPQETLSSAASDPVGTATGAVGGLVPGG